MRCGIWLGIVVGTWFAVVPSAEGGVYVSSDARTDELRLNEFRLNPIRLQRNLLQALPNRLDTPERARYVEIVKALKAKELAGTLTEQDRADLGGLYLRLGRDPLDLRTGRDAADAARILSAGNGRQFLILCNLAVANYELAKEYQDVNRLQEALITQRRALDAWPAAWNDWSYEQWFMNRRVESLHLKLLEARFAEMRLEGSKPQGWQTVDRIFPGFTMVGPSGEYEAGRVAPRALDALPADAPWLVRELMMAYPTDARLYWLFGELLNAGGRVEDALQVLDDLVNVNQMSNVRELMAHRRVLLERASLLGDLRKEQLFRSAAPGGPSPVMLESLLWSLSPPPALAVPIVGPAAIQWSWWATTGAVEALQRQERLGRPVSAADLSLPPDPTEPQSTASDARQSPLPDWRVLLVGFGAGVFVSIVVGLQRIEWKRRRQATLSRRQPVG
jgi:tetratricopeptide (TPR) repeat protein